MNRMMLKFACKDVSLSSSVRGRRFVASPHWLIKRTTKTEQTSYYDMLLSVTNPSENKQGAHIKHSTLCLHCQVMLHRPGSLWVSLRLQLCWSLPSHRLG